MTTVADPRVRRERKEDAHKLTAVGGLAALSLDALSSVAYGPEAIVVALAAAGAGAIGATLPISIAIAVLLLVLVVSYRQVIAVHPDGGGAYAVAKADLGRPVALLAAASLVVDYVLTVAVSLAAGAASLGSVFPSLAHHLLLVSLIGLVALFLVNLVGIAESAKVLMLPTLVFVVAVLGTVVVGLVRGHEVATVGHDLGPLHATEALGVVLVLKAFAAGCSALTGVEAIANGVPSFRSPAVRRAQRTELSLGVLLGVMLVGLAVLIHLRHVVPRGDVTVLAQLSAGAFGTGWPYYATNIAVTLVLAFAANTSYGGLPILMSLLAKDNRLPHLFGLRAERPVYRYGVVVLTVLAAVLLVVLEAKTDRLLPLFAIGVFIGFTISQVGLVRHWHRVREGRWRAKAALAGTGAVLTAIAAVVFLASKFTEGAWVLLVIVPVLVLLFARVQSYYDGVARQIGLFTTPAKPQLSDLGGRMTVVVPVANVSELSRLALTTAAELGGRVLPVAVEVDEAQCEDLQQRWYDWDPGIDLQVLPSPHRSLVDPVVDLVKDLSGRGQPVTVLLAELEPRRSWQEVLHNQRGVVLAAALRARTDAVVANQRLRLR